MLYPQLALQILLAIMVGWLANYFVSERTPEATRDAYLYAVGIPAIFLALGLSHAWAFLWGHEHGEHHLKLIYYIGMEGN